MSQNYRLLSRIGDPMCFQNVTIFRYYFVNFRRVSICFDELWLHIWNQFNTFEKWSKWIQFGKLIFTGESLISIILLLPSQPRLSLKTRRIWREKIIKWKKLAIKLLEDEKSVINAYQWIRLWQLDTDFSLGHIGLSLRYELAHYCAALFAKKHVLNFQLSIQH